MTELINAIWMSMVLLPEIWIFVVCIIFMGMGAVSTVNSLVPKINFKEEENG